MSNGETTGERRAPGRELPQLGRRAFLGGSIVTAAAIAAGCGGSSGPGATKATTTSAPSLGPTTTVHSAKLTGDPFQLGIASGDPDASSVVLWTRLAPKPLALDAKGGMPAGPVDVIWELATDARFTKVVSRGVETAEPSQSHSVHVHADGLDAGTDHYYRFTVGDFTSPPGRTRTLPSGSPKAFNLAVANCQWREAGRYAAYRDMAEGDYDLVLHLGDYIYELAGNAGPKGDRPTEPGHLIETLADYRLRHASYRLDEHLRAAHARFPFVVVWDDHDVANNYMGDTLPTSNDVAFVQARKAAAYQAWWEHMPTRFDPPTGSDLAIYQALDIGDLARIVMLDERQDAAIPPCRDTALGDYGDCDDRLGEDRTRLGAAQETFTSKALAKGGVTWNLLGNPVVLAGVDAGGGSSAFYLDTWDGYPEARIRLIEQLAASTNPVVLTGDYHAGMVLDVHATPFDQGSKVVAPEFMAPPISSPLFDADVSKRTPQLRQQLNSHGYLGVTVTPDLLTAHFKVVADVNDAASKVTEAATWQVQAGDPVATKV